MADTLGIKLEGDVTLGTFAKVMESFHALLKVLTAEIAGPDAVHWQIADLQPGSAYAEVRGIAQGEVEVGQVVQAYDQVSQAVAKHAPAPYAVTVGAHVNELVAAAADGRIKRMLFYVAGDPIAWIVPTELEAAPVKPPTTLGSVSGIVETIARRPHLWIGVYDDVFDRRVSCYLHQDQYDWARSVWGKRVTVSGRVERDPHTGRLLSVRDVLQVQEQSGNEVIRRARGVLPWQPGDEPAETAIRRIRDAS